MKRPGIALMITLFFIMAITVAVGISLTVYNQGKNVEAQYRLLAQTAMSVDDVVRLLQEGQMFAEVKDAATLKALLELTEAIALDYEGLEVMVSMRSARAGVNINALAASEALQEKFTRYLMRYNVQDPQYLTDLLLDCMQGEQATYRTRIFDAMPQLYRVRIASAEHLEQILEYYIKQRFDLAVRDIPWQELFWFDDHEVQAADLNHMSAHAWQLLFPDMPDETITLLSGSGQVYTTYDELPLRDEDVRQLQSMNIKLYVPVVWVELELFSAGAVAEVALEFDIASKAVKVVDYAL
jgi:hypothetical protein